MIRLTIWMFKLGISIFFGIIQFFIIIIRGYFYKDPPLDIKYEDYHVELPYEKCSAELPNTRNVYKNQIMVKLDGVWVPTKYGCDDMDSEYGEALLIVLKDLRAKDRKTHYIIKRNC